MIADYARFHGPVLVELVAALPDGLSIRANQGDSRTVWYTLNERVGLHVKHSAARMRPWKFSFLRPVVDELTILAAQAPIAFVAFVCGIDGICVVRFDEFLSLVSPYEAPQVWVRADRRRRGQYGMSGSAGRLSAKRAAGVSSLAVALLD